MEQSTLLEIAIRTAKEPWSTVDEKLGALAGLESLGSEEAVDALVDAMALTSLYSKDADRSSPKFPMSGEVAGAAARALGRIEPSSTGDGGIPRLVRIIKNGNLSIGLRECAIYGLGGLTNKKAFEVYTDLLDSMDGVLWNRLLRSISESLARIDTGHSAHASAFLVSFFNKVARKIKDGMNADVIAPCVQILAENLPDKGEAEIKALSIQAKRTSDAWLAIKILCTRKKGFNIEDLAAVLCVTGFPGEIYEEVANRLSVEPRDKLLKPLAKASKSPSGFKRMLLKFSAEMAENEAIRQRAVSRLLNIGRRGA